VVRAIRDIFCVYFVMDPKRVVITFSLGAVSVIGFGLKSWLIVPFSMCLWIGKV
jgi:type IV secretory pathway TrbD component